MSEAPAGAPTRLQLTRARRGLRLDLRTLLHTIMETGRGARCDGSAVADDVGRVQTVNLSIAPMGEATGACWPAGEVRQGKAR